MGEAPEATVLVESVADAEALELPADARLAYITQTTLSVDETREIIDVAAAPLPADRRARARGHLLRDVQPAVGREGAARPRSACCSSSARTTRRTRCVSSRSRAPPVFPRISSTTQSEIDERVARRRRGGRRHVGRVRAGAPRARGVRLVPRARRRRHRRVPLGLRGRRLQAPGRAAPRRALGSVGFLGRARPSRLDSTACRSSTSRRCSRASPPRLHGRRAARRSRSRQSRHRAAAARRGGALRQPHAAPTRTATRRSRACRR